MALRRNVCTAVTSAHSTAVCYISHFPRSRFKADEKGRRSLCRGVWTTSELSTYTGWRHHHRMTSSLPDLLPTCSGSESPQRPGSITADWPTEQQNPLTHSRRHQEQARPCLLRPPPISFSSSVPSRPSRHHVIRLSQSMMLEPIVPMGSIYHHVRCCLVVS